MCVPVTLITSTFNTFNTFPTAAASSTTEYNPVASTGDTVVTPAGAAACPAVTIRATLGRSDDTTFNAGVAFPTTFTRSGTVTVFTIRSCRAESISNSEDAIVSLL
ncbi:MAG: hypothetical protein ACOYOV_00390 [Bacteroidales bacterium]